MLPDKSQGTYTSCEIRESPGRASSGWRQARRERSPGRAVPTPAIVSGDWGNLGFPKQSPVGHWSWVGAVLGLGLHGRSMQLSFKHSLPELTIVCFLWGLNKSLLSQPQFAHLWNGDWGASSGELTNGKMEIMTLSSVIPWTSIWI